jgi:hypothetical protein
MDTCASAAKVRYRAAQLAVPAGCVPSSATLASRSARGTQPLNRRDVGRLAETFVRRDVPDELVARFLEAIDERWEARQPNLPGIVYHYTSIAAFRGITTSGCLWATTTSALNDTTELTHAQEILKQTLVRHSAEARLPEFRVLYPPQLHEVRGQISASLAR